MSEITETAPPTAPEAAPETGAPTTPRGTRYAIYGSVRAPIPEGTSNADVRAVMERRYPELANSSMLERADGNIEFVATAGEKG